MEYAFNIASLCGYDAGPTLPSHADNLSIFHKNRNCVRCGGDLSHASQRLLVRLHVKLLKIFPRPFQPFAHLAGVRASRGSVQLQVRHLQIPPSHREECDKSTPELPECAEYNRSARSAQNPRDLDEQFLRRHNLLTQL